MFGKRRYKKTLALVAFMCTTALVICCKDRGNKDMVSENIPKAIAKENRVDIEDYFPGANFMGILMAENSAIDLTGQQKDILAQWHSENHARIVAILEQISDLDGEIKFLSQEGTASRKIKERLENREKQLREIFATKMSCRDLVRNTLDNEQWKRLIATYKKKHPFVERTEMMEIMSHVNPVPNYMQALTANAEKLELTIWQRQKFEAWSEQHHSKMMEWAKSIIALEKEVYKKSFENTTREKLMGEFQMIQKLRSNIVATKTDCRNMVMNTLTQKQWKGLIALTD